MRIERQHHRPDTLTSGRLDQPLHDPGVPHVQAVEIPDRYETATHGSPVTDFSHQLHQLVPLNESCTVATPLPQHPPYRNTRSQAV
jgi:hypothetical protein